jgi:hypothetical protein
VTLADVNGDSWVDVIEVELSKLSVFINTNGKFSSVFSTTVQYGYSVAAGDVNSDNRPDIYVMRGQDAAGANAPDQVYFNDGAGTSFTRMSSIPSKQQTPQEFPHNQRHGHLLRGYVGLLHKRHYLQTLQEGLNHQALSQSQL